MFRLEKDFRFEASHVLPFHEGKCSRLHGHSWKGSAIFEGVGLQVKGSSTGMLMDFSDISKVVDVIVEDCLDHYHLNDLLDTPTSERLAEWMFNQIKPHFPNLKSVRIEETCTSRCEYIGPDYKD